MHRVLTAGYWAGMQAVGHDSNTQDKQQSQTAPTASYWAGIPA